ncbi:MAG: type II toxin-antitoxin system VapC family toxin [Candidatus Micrarchaeota archaeon]|nr:type II toxin-antitoxin system VapC family toxin [Candidatus Micrarchaeota archaeon]
MVVLDTNVIIDFLEGKENIVAEVSKYPPSELSMTFVNEYELLKYKNRERLEPALQNLAVHHSNEAAVRAAANSYRQLKAKGKMLSDNDIMIYGVCTAHDEVLLTQDKGFEELGSNRVIVLG